MRDIVAINASPIKRGTVDKLLRVFEKSLSNKHKATRINLYDFDFPPHGGNLEREPLKYPFIKDIRKAHAIIIATPTYWFNMPGILKNFLDMRCRAGEEVIVLDDISWVYI